MAFDATRLQPVSRHPVASNVVWHYQTDDDDLDTVTADGYFSATNTGLAVNDIIMAVATDGLADALVTAIDGDGNVTTSSSSGSVELTDIAIDSVGDPIEPDIGGSVVPEDLREELEKIHQRLVLKVQSLVNVGGGTSLSLGNDFDGTDTASTGRRVSLRTVKAGDGIQVSTDTDGALIIALDGEGGGGVVTNPNDVSRNVAAVKHAFSGSVSDFGDNGVDDWSLNLNFPEPEHTHSRANVSSNPAPFAGSRSLQTEIRPGDRQWNNNGNGGGDGFSDKRRAEYSWRPERFDAGSSGTTIPEGWFGGAFYLPSDPMADIKGAAIFQLHNSPDPGVMWNIFLFDGRLRSEIDFPDRDNVDLMNIDVTPFLDTWTRMVVRFKPSTGSNGFIQLFLNETEIYNRAGQNKSAGLRGPYAKHGLYFWGYDRFDFGLEGLVLHDNLTIADENGSFDLVDPRTFPRTD